MVDQILLLASCSNINSDSFEKSSFVDQQRKCSKRDGHPRDAAAEALVCKKPAEHMKKGGSTALL
jgi:hypothetical protein